MRHEFPASNLIINHMKSIQIIIILIIISFFYGCISKRFIPSESVKLKPDESLFLQAEKLFEKKMHTQAIDKYKAYLERFPEKQMAPAALMKIGIIETLQKNYTVARTNYARLIKEYPESIFVANAMVASLQSYYQERQYLRVLSYAPQILNKIILTDHITSIYLILGDTFIAEKYPVDAVYYYSLAYETADPPTRAHLLIKLKKTINLITHTYLTDFFRFINKKHSEAAVLYLVGNLKLEAGDYDDAKKILSEFVKKFPKHENVSKAYELLNELENLGIYKENAIGCLLPLSGQYKVYGNKALQAIELALSKFTSRNKNKFIKIIIKDTGSDPDKAAIAVHELCQEGAAAIIGPIFSVEKAAFEAQKKGMPIITLTQKDHITEIGDFVFRNFFTPQMQVKEIVSFAIEEIGIDRFAVLYPEEKYGKIFMNLFCNEVISSGGVITGLESYNPGHTDFADPIKKLAGINDIHDNIAKKTETVIDFDAIFIPDGPKRAGLIIPQLAYYDIKDVYIFGTNLWHSDKLIKMARKYVQNAIMPDIFFAESSAPDVQDFVKTYQAVFKNKPGFIESVAYDTAMILFGIINRDDLFFRNTIKNELIRSTGFEGITGYTKFTENGDVEKKLYLLKIKGKKIVEIKQ